MNASAVERKREVVAAFRRQEILDAAAAVFSRGDFDKTKVDDIAAEAGLAKATVYAYFRSKDEIYEAVVEEVLAELFTRTEKQVSAADTFVDRLAAFIAVRLDYWNEKQVFYRAMLRVDAEITNRDRTLGWTQRSVDVLAGIFQKAHEAGDLPRQDFQLHAWFLMDLLRGSYERRLLERHTLSISDEVIVLTRFVLQGLRGGTVDASGIL